MSLKVGDVVQLKADVRRPIVPEGREDNKTATIRALLEHGGLFLNRDLHGMKWWNVQDVEIAKNKDK
jgi:hypothetical protein